MNRSCTHRSGVRAAAILAALVLGLTFGVSSFASAAADAATSDVQPTIVLVHGAWADGSSWGEVTTRLQAAGFDVRVPPNNLRGVASDAADLASYVASISGPVVLVGHSYGGMVITNAAQAPQVTSLVYVNALIPAEGDTLVGMTHPPSIFAQDPANVLTFAPYTGAPESAMDTYVKTSIYGEAFANAEFSPSEIAVLAATQRPLSTQVFEEPSGPPAWVAIRSWAVVGTNDRIIPIADQISMARRAGAELVEVDAPHLSMITDDRTVADVIIEAAQSS